MVLFWASPIVYSFTFVHDKLHGGLLEQLYLANPVTIAVLGFQKALWAAVWKAPARRRRRRRTTSPCRLVVALFISLVLLWLAQRVFARLQGNFAQEL